LMTTKDSRSQSNNPPVWTPTPDPTLLTTQALQREVTALRELYDSKFVSYDKAINLLQEISDKAPSINVVDERLKAMDAVLEVRFKSIDLQFAERDTRTNQLSSAQQTAINAAFSAAASANEKQNANTSKQIDLMVATLTETTKGIVSGIDDLKARVGAIESRGAGSHATWGSIGMVVASVAAGLVIFQIMLAFLMKGHG
jgi:hypothetical protein